MTSKECALPTQSLAQPKKRKKVFVSGFFHLWLWWQTTSENCAGLRAASCQVDYSNSLPRSHSNTVQIQIQLKHKSKYAAYSANTHTATSKNTNLNKQTFNWNIAIFSYFDYWQLEQGRYWWFLKRKNQHLIENDTEEPVQFVSSFTIFFAIV